MYIPEFVCGIIVGAVGVVAIIVGVGLYLTNNDSDEKNE